MGDKLNSLRSKYLELISAKEAEIKQIRQKLSLIDELEADSHKFNNNGLAMPSRPNLVLSAPATTTKYAGMKLTKAIFDAVKAIGANGGVSATNIRNYIENNGYRHPNMKNFPVATVIALTRLVRRGEIESLKTPDGKRKFRKIDVSEFK
jgi:hypothetical protein